MAKIVVIIFLFVFMVQGQASCQSILDSVFGPGGLGIWGTPQQTPSFDHPQYYGGGVDPNQQFGPQQQMGSSQGYGQQYPPPQAYGYGQVQPMDSGQGYYPNWQHQPPPGAPMPPYVQGQVQPPPQQVPQAQASQPRQAQPRAQRSTRPRAGAQIQTDQSQVGKFGDPLPAGAARVTTTTPEGTTVYYYPPSGIQEADQYGGPSQQPRPRAASSRSVRPQQEVAPQPEQAPRSSIAMPKPVTIPQGQDPRSGWSPN